MAIAGSATSAYRVWIDSDTVHSVPTTTLSTLCVKPDIAIGMMVNSETVTVAGSDMEQLRTLWISRQQENEAKAKGDE